ncbi:MAG TPA: hypothetical protein DCP49_10605, partial [Erysipelotrichaceae bacterium]|nr:hypothetical protein [Erysipelotrichaceae bacterium]
EFDAPAAFMPDIDTARIQLTAWSSAETINFDVLKKEVSELFMEERDSYNMPLTLHAVLEQNSNLGRFQGLSIQKGTGQVRYTIEEENMQYVITIDDLVFELIERNEHEGK